MRLGISGGACCWAIAGCMLIASTASADMIQWSAENGGNDHWYGLTSVTTWADAEQQAIAAGGHLVTINDQAENDWLAATFSGGFRRSSYFIGFNDAAQEGTWTWVAGDGGWWEAGNAASTSYVNWAGGQPAAILDGEDYGWFHWQSSSGQWGDGLDNGINGAGWAGIIEIVAAPEPASLSLLAACGLGLLRRRPRRTAA